MFNKKMPVWSIIVIDLLSTWACLCIFALFHHVISTAYSPDLSKQNAETAAVSEETADTGITAEAESYTLAQDKFASMFTSGAVEQTDTTYKSKDVNLTLNKVNENGVTYFVLDIYLRDVKCLRTAFAKDTFGKGITETILGMAKNNGALAAVNGDYYGTHSNRGLVIRNGYTYRYTEAYGDVCVLYSDGTMAGMTENDYNNASDHTGFLKDVWQGWCFGPILVENGQANTGMTGDTAGKNPRTGIGYYEPGHYCLVVVDGRQDGYSVGMTYDEFAQCFADLGCVFAFNLDGGQSSVMTYGGAVANKPTKGGREVSDIIYIGE